jgi:hypothetical protein
MFHPQSTPCACCASIRTLAVINEIPEAMQQVLNCFMPAYIKKAFKESETTQHVLYCIKQNKANAGIKMQHHLIQSLTMFQRFTSSTHTCNNRVLAETLLLLK